jgi:hypothetical protein
MATLIATLAMVLGLVSLASVGLIIIVAHLVETAHASPLCPTRTPFDLPALSETPGHRETDIAEAACFLASLPGFAPEQEEADWAATAQELDSAFTAPQSRDEAHSA